MEPLIKYRCCGSPYTHDAHWFFTGAKNVAGAADYYCIGKVPAYKFSRGMEE